MTEHKTTPFDFEKGPNNTHMFALTKLLAKQKLNIIWTPEWEVSEQTKLLVGIKIVPPKVYGNGFLLWNFFGNEIKSIEEAIASLCQLDIDIYYAACPKEKQPLPKPIME